MSQKQWIQPDSRGRIQLPKEFRHHTLFELITQDPHQLVIRPLETRAVPLYQPWDRERVAQFFREKIFPALMEFCRDRSEVWALALYGSRARGDFMNTSDIDLIVFVEKVPPMSQRALFMDALQAELQPLLSILQAQGSSAELSLIFAPRTFEREVSPPALYFSIAADGLMIYQREDTFKKWRRGVMAFKTAHKVNRVGQGKSAVWKRGGHKK